jgi:hypothetical protein
VHSIATAVNSFGGYINGNGHTISNMVINETGEDNVGFIGWSSANAKVQVENLNIVLANVTGDDDVGILAGHVRNHATFRNIFVQGSVSSNGNGGGVFGVFEGYGENIRADVNVSGDGNQGVGGFVGNLYDTGVCENCHVSGTITKTGGFVAGGFAGGINGGEVYNSSADVVVNSTSYDVGGFVGEVNSSAIIKFCAAYGDVESATNNVGGFVGELRSGTIEDNFSTGNVTTVNGSFVGGFAGDVEASGVLNRNYSSAANVVGNTSVHGFVGQVDVAATLANNYWDNTLIPDTDSVTPDEWTGIPTVSMDTAGNFTNWDFNTVWRVFANDRPELISAD